jgi:2-keto-3-deoxy-L-fuconate dehydrogenase
MAYCAVEVVRWVTTSIPGVGLGQLCKTPRARFLLCEVIMFKNILLATDGSDVSARAAKMAVDLARSHDSTLTAVYVVQPYPYLDIGEANPYGAQAYMAALQSLAAEAHMAVKKLCTEGGPAVTLEARVVEHGSVATGVLETAQTEGADLIVMGSHGRSGLARVMRGQPPGADRALVRRSSAILVTQAAEFMGPAFCEVFAEQGAEVIANHDAPSSTEAVQHMLAEAGEFDVLVANLSILAPSTPAADVSADEWQAVFAALVDPLPRLVKAVVPVFQRRGGGKILVVGSASALKGMKRASTYSAARGAQGAYVQAVGVELAAQNIQVNAIAQNFVENPTYFPPEVQANPRFKDRLAREVPLGRLVMAREDALFAAYLCSDAANCFVGQVFPVSGGWAVK